METILTISQCAELSGSAIGYALGYFFAYAFAFWLGYVFCGFLIDLIKREAS